MISRVLVLLLLLAVPALADCPAQYPCPYDGEAGHNTYYCKGHGETRACQYKHEVWHPKHEVHYYWVACGK